jgi:HEAT repeat protein
MSNMRAVLMAAMTLVVAAPMVGQDVPAQRTVGELIATLKSDASQKDKADVCRELARVGTKEAVPVLAALLADERLAHMARYALEPMPDSAVDEALRAALGRLKGRRLVGVICSIGVRRDGQALPLLAKLLQDADADVAQAAARAIGRLETVEAATALQNALADATAANHLALCEGLFRCAAGLNAQGHRVEAVAIYDRLRGLSGPQQVRGGALCAAILARQRDGLPLVAEHLRSPDYVLFAAAIRAAQQLRDPGTTSVLIDALGQLPDERQIPTILALGKRRDSAALPALMAKAKASAKPVRLAAIRSLAELGQAKALPALLESLGDTERDVAQAGQESLAALPGREVDAAVMAMFADANANRRLTALALIGRRRMTSATAALLKAAGESDPQIRSAALQRLGELGGPAELPALLEMLRGKQLQDFGAVETAISGVLSRLERPEPYVDKLTALLAQASPAQKGALLRILGSIGGASALKTVHAAIGDPNAEVQAVAIRVLVAWKTPDSAPGLLSVARSADNPSHKILALRAYLSWAGRADLPADQRLAMCRQAAQLAQRTEEQRQLLSALGNVDSPEALALITPYLSASATKNEAAMAAVSAAERLLKRPDAAGLAAKLVEPLQKVAQAAVPLPLAQRAKAAIQQAQRAIQSKEP